MKRLFRAFEELSVQYLLISGQACVLYGASQFTEDIDFWIEPSPPNFHHFLEAMARMNATVYKLTPPIIPFYVRKGHGFHFRIGSDWYIDVMGKPPRVGRFTAALKRARNIATEWGKLKVAAPEDLVLLKQTNRPGDYEAISNLVRQRTSEDNQTTTLRWALTNTFDIQDLVEFALKATDLLKQWPDRKAVRALLPIRSGQAEFAPQKVRRAADALVYEMSELQEKGRRYWKPIIADLKRLQRRDQLIPEGIAVANLLQEGRRHGR